MREKEILSIQLAIQWPKTHKKNIFQTNCSQTSLILSLERRHEF
jgi:hypothetical protein